MKAAKKRILAGSLVFVLIPLVFIVDLITPLGYAEWLLYIIPLLVSSWHGGRKILITNASVSTLFIIGGFFLSPSGSIDIHIAVFNRITIIILVWIVAVLLLQRRQAEEEVIKSEALFRGIFEQSPIGINVYDSKGILIEANAASHLIFGSEDYEALKGISLFKNPNIPDDIKAGIAKGKTLAFEVPYDFEAVRKTNYFRTIKSGKIFLSEILTPIGYDARGESKGFLLLVEDITQRKLAEEKLKSTVDELDRSNKELERFAYVASHDLQEPLRMVASYTQLLANRYKGKLDSEADVFINYAVDGANRMKKLISDLLAYSRLSKKMEMKETDLNVLIENVRNVLALAIKESGALIIADPLPPVKGDETQLFQLFQNLLANAIKFRNSKSPEITIKAKRDKNEWIISVSDNGIGIDPAYYNKIFIVFQRLHAGNKYQGTGIGLAICKRIVENHGGRIWVESDSNKGSRFYFTLPALNPEL